MLEVTIVMIFVDIQIVGKHANGEKINVMKSACIVEHLRYSYCNFRDVKYKQIVDKHHCCQERNIVNCAKDGGSF